MRIHAHDGEDAIPRREIPRRIQVARTRQVDEHFLLDGGGAAGHDEDAVGQLHRFFDVVRDEEDGFLLSLPDANQILPHLETGEEIERAERFIHVKHSGIGGEGAGNLDPLPHAAGKFARIRFLEANQPDHLDVMVDALGAFRCRPFEQTEADILLDGEPGKTPFS